MGATRHSRRRSGQRRRRSAAVGVTAMMAVLGGLLAAPASAGFSGPNGQIAIERDGRVVLMNPDGTAERVLANGRDPAVSPDGRRVAFAAFSAPGRCNRINGYIRVINIDGTGLRDVTSPGRPECDASRNKDEFQPAWSPDGARIAFVSSRTLAFDDIWVTASAGGGLRQLTSGAAFDTHPDWSPDGRTIIFSRIDDTHRRTADIWAMNPD